MELHNFDHLVTLAAQNGDSRVVAVASAEDLHVVEAAVHAKKAGIARPILIGRRDTIADCLHRLGEASADYQIESPSGEQTAGELAVALVRSGDANFLMKGQMETSALLRPVVNREHGIGMGRTMSHIGLQQIPGYPKLLGNTDAAMVPYPDLAQKRDILLNAVDLFHSLGYSFPKVACLCCKETVDPKMPETIDGYTLQEMCERGELGSCQVVGPISYDIAVSPEIARMKQFDNPCCGNFDILLQPNIHAGNILGKCLEVTCHASMAGVVLGARVPIVLTSRGASAEEKFHSIALAAVAAGG